MKFMLPGYLHLAEQGHRLVQSYLPLCRRFMLPLVGIPENELPAANAK